MSSAAWSSSAHSRWPPSPLPPWQTQTPVDTATITAHAALGYEIGDSGLVGGFGPSLHLDQVEGSFDEPGLGVGTTHGWVPIIEPTSPIRLG